jgi:LysM domain
VRAKALVVSCGIAALTALPGPAEAQLAAPAPAEQAAAPSSELRTGPASVAPHWSRNKYPDSIPEGATYYIVVRGDTLWDISKRFLGNAYLWPQIWDSNRYITDAHWIYPGDPVILPKIALIAERAGEAGAEAEGVEEDEGLPGEVGAGTGPSALFPITEEVTMQCAHYIVSDREDESLYVIGSEQGGGKVALAERDILYLNKGSNAGVRAGDVYTLNHFAYSVRHPDSGRKLGQKIEVTGWARVILVEENTATAVVEQACNDIHAGDYLKPYERVSVPLALRRPPADRLTPPSGKTSGFIVDVADDAVIAGAGHILSIDLGSEDGLAPGNMLTVYRIMYPSVPTSRNVVGELAVVAVREHTATAKVMYSNDAMSPGDQVELR